MGMPLLKKGEILQGKWCKNQYKIIKKIGEGGTGTVYLVQDMKNSMQYALKLTQDSVSINREYQLLNKFSKLDFVANVYGIDDTEISGEKYYFILIEYIAGTNLKKYTDRVKLNTEIILGIMLIILKGLEEFHKAGYVLVDLKPENMMLDRSKKLLKLIDLGGVVQKGHAIKEFTPAYDRASWKCGERIAEETYDLFAATMILIKFLLRENLNPRCQNISDVVKKISEANVTIELRNCIIRALVSTPRSLQDFANQLNELYNIERLNRKSLAKRKQNNKIDLALAVSFLIFLTTIILLLVDKA